MMASPSDSMPAYITVVIWAPEARMRPLNQIAAELSETVAPLPRCEYLQTYLAPLFTLTDCTGYYGMDSVIGLVGHAHAAIDYQAGLSVEIAQGYQRELAAHLRSVGSTSDRRTIRSLPEYAAPA